MQVTPSGRADADFRYPDRPVVGPEVGRPEHGTGDVGAGGHALPQMARQAPAANQLELVLSYRLVAPS